jgi:hypothetical protein
MEWHLVLLEKRRGGQNIYFTSIVFGIKR